MAGWVRRHPVAAYFVLAYALSWAVWIPMAPAGLVVRQGTAWPTHWPGLFGPFISAFVITWVVAGRAGLADLGRRLVRWRVHPLWYLVALSPLAFFGLAAAGMQMTGQGWPDLAEMGRFSGLPTVGAALMWVLLLGNGFGEETGWRGFAVPELRKSRGLLATALIVGLLWAAWHVPSLFVIQNYRELGAAVLPGFFLGILAGSIFLAWLYLRSGGSVLIVSLWHATYNLVSGTAAAHGLVAAIVSSAVMAWALVIVAVELRHWWAGRGAGAPGLGAAAG